MNLNFLKIFVIISILEIPFLSFSQYDIYGDTITQISTINSLMSANYDSDIKISQVKKYGDFGLGSVNALDGELILLDKKYYVITIDGKISDVDDQNTTPYLTATFFDDDIVFDIKDASLDILKKTVNEKLKKNYFFAIKVVGEFDYVKTRSIKPKKPYPPLVDVIKEQNVFEMNNIKGTLVGFYSPEFISGITPAGYHIHFLSDDKTGAGHLLECKIRNAKVFMDFSDNLNLKLPGNFKPGTDNPDDVKKVEQDRK